MVPEGPNDIFIAGDAHQRIYRHKVVLGHCSINIRGRGRKLRINYRTTDQIRKWAVSLLKDIPFDDLDGGEDNQKAFRSLLQGMAPEIRLLDSFQEETEHISAYLKNLSESALAGTRLVARTHKMIEQYAHSLNEKGVRTCFIRRSHPENRSEPGLRLATMHRVKGLEFDRIIIAGVNDGVVPLGFWRRRQANPRELLVHGHPAH